MEITQEIELVNLSKEKMEFEDQISGYETTILQLNGLVQDHNIPPEKRRESMQLIGYYNQILSEKNEVLSDIRVSIFKIQQSYKQYQETLQKVQQHRSHNYPHISKKSCSEGNPAEIHLKEITKLSKSSKKLF